jgi:general secretion pathway protein K
MVIVLVLFVIGLSSLVSNRLGNIKYFRDTNRAMLLALSGINKMRAEINKEAKSSWYDALNETWSNNPEQFQEIKIGTGAVSVSYAFEGPAKSYTFYGCEDEERRININKAGRPVLTNLFRKVAGMPDEATKRLVSAIMDWRDTNTTVEPDGAEDEHYRTLTPAYPCKNRDFEFTEELMLVREMTADIFARIKNYITVYGTGRVNINTAPVNTLFALGLDEPLINKIYNFRTGQDGELGTKDDNIITKSAELMTKLSGFTFLAPAEIEALNNLIIQDLISAESKYYRIKALGTINNRTREVTCIVQRGGPIVYWREM